ncbi:MAG: Type I restriction-modification system, specificity subunit S [Candidatus Carbobacillus altaicus]|uniref:Type I restriction-modification system, specificity subunit S n=1 Tax=Candidatus Carbonibacillus altaicus TaxID=2163959 RepID=A0A2R6XZH9_9BACL|nr:MAG: Type I restriction-modification system, specificity subunit S [Candidatus Carbobacillus altaicus]
MIDGLKPYPAYKDSGMEWLGQVPEHWEVRRLKVAVAHINEQTNANNPDALYIALEHVESWTGRLRLPSGDIQFDSQVKRFRAGDVLFGKLRPYLAKVVRPEQSGVCVGEFFVLRAKSVVSPHYLEVVLRSVRAIDFVNSSTYGAKMPRADWTFVGAMLFPLPPIPEQTAIVRFLDWADWRIRRVIRARQRRIKLLEEYKQALIHQAVTGKIDVRTGRPYPAYKPSGVEWLGDVPAHWEVRRLKHVAHIHTGGTPAGLLDEAFDENGIPWVKPDHLLADKGLLDPDRRLSIKAAQSIGIIKRGSLLVCGIGSVGKVGFAPYDLCTNQQINAITFSRAIFERFGHFLGLCLAQEFVKRSNKVTIAICNKSQMGEVSICVPPLNQQTAIVEYLDAQTAKIDAAISATRHAIELLREYRERLIADVVTGKVDVREVAAQLPEEPDEEDASWMDNEERAQGETLNGEDDHAAISEEDE